MPLKSSVEELEYTVLSDSDKIAIIWTVICVVCWSIQLQSYLIHFGLSISSIFDFWIQFYTFFISHFCSTRIFSPPSVTQFAQTNPVEIIKKAESVAGKIMKLNWIPSFSFIFRRSMQRNFIIFFRSIFD